MPRPTPPRRGSYNYNEAGDYIGPGRDSGGNYDQRGVWGPNGDTYDRSQGRQGEAQGGWQDTDDFLRQIPVVGGFLSDTLGVGGNAAGEAADRERRMADWLLRNGSSRESEGVDSRDPAAVAEADALRGTNAQDVAAQRRALGMMAGAAQGGTDAIDRGGMAQMQAGLSAGNAAAIQRGAANAQATGMRGGAQLRGQLGAQGAAYQQAGQSQVGLDQAAQARALQAMQSRGALGSSMRRSSFDERTRQAGARDARSASDVAFRQGVRARNVDRETEKAVRRGAMSSGMADINDNRAARQEDQDANTLNSALMLAAGL